MHDKAIEPTRASAGFTARGIDNLAKPEADGLRSDLTVFAAYWGLDAYTPPPQITKAVRDIVSAFVADANAIANSDRPKDGA